ncbi:hypothetical protein H6F76_03065 [Leptolyngbya sp. FACHB-321]|uniref:hypothetical protein n=1 Tax=Leptolyngbya sp. FACHB-321 TaxID=2692807 RepID=UPI001684B564|nr:hypothetical protein [Leptolyngbya sp. FACHB-321]MBD2034031.1 hypothetical protein [Leptolyngbya sp. FACHB-321]
MIEFNCGQCKKEFKVDDSKAGVKGKCPKCSSIIVVPAVSTTSDQLIFIEDDNFFSDSKLNQLYKEFLRLRESMIYGHQILNETTGDTARFEIATKPGRSQFVWLYNFTTDRNESWVSICSIVGEITLVESAVHALRAVDAYAPYGIRLTEDNQLVLTSIAKISNLDTDLLDRTILMVAVKADELEETLFGADRL